MTELRRVVVRAFAWMLLALAILGLRVAMAAAPSSAAPTVGTNGCLDGMKVEWIRAEGKKAAGKGAAVTVAPDGAIYFAAEQNPATLHRKVATLSKYGAAGARARQRRLPGLGNSSSYIAGLAVGTDGLIYVAGDTGGSNARGFLAVYRENGTLDAYRRLGHGQIFDIAASRDGAVYIVRSAGPDRELLRLAAAGATVDWTEALADYPVAVSVDASGGVYTIGYSLLTKRDPRQVAWVASPRLGSAGGVDVFATGDHAVILYKWQTDNGILYPASEDYLSDGTPGWEQGTKSPFDPVAITVDTNGRTWLAGAYGAGGALSLLDGNGAGLAFRRFRILGSRVAEYGVAPGLTGAVFVAGRADGKELLGQAINGQATLMKVVAC